MKMILLILLPLFSFSQNTFHGCQLGGDSKHEEVRSADSLKNRFEIPKSYKKISLKVLLNEKVGGIDGTYPIEVSGYIVDVAQGGIESCNCHSKAYRDTHIYVAFDDGETYKKKCVIAEITPRIRANNPTWTTAYIKETFKGKQVIIDGYLFCDAEHKMNSAIDDKTSTNLWRASTYEIHPVTDIKLLQ